MMGLRRDGASCREQDYCLAGAGISKHLQTVEKLVAQWECVRASIPSPVDFGARKSRDWRIHLDHTRTQHGMQTVFGFKVV
jgi:hypothetical protein